MGAARRIVLRRQAAPSRAWPIPDSQLARPQGASGVTTERILLLPQLAAKGHFDPQPAPATRTRMFEESSGTHASRPVTRTRAVVRGDVVVVGDDSVGEGPDAGHGSEDPGEVGLGSRWLCLATQGPTPGPTFTGRRRGARGGARGALLSAHGRRRREAAVAASPGQLRPVEHHTSAAQLRQY